MSPEQRHLKTRQLSGFKARENQCEDTVAAIARLEAELADHVDQVDPVVAQLRGRVAELERERDDALTASHAAQDALANERADHAATSEKLAGAFEKIAQPVRIRKDGASRSTR